MDTPAISAASTPGSDEPAARFGRPAEGWRLALYRVIFESDTPPAAASTWSLIWLIVVSVAVVMLDSFEHLPRVGGPRWRRSNGSSP